MKAARTALLALVVAIAGWFVVPWEGESLTGYSDIVGVATACDGHTGAGVEVGKVYTREQCRAWLQSDIGIAAEGVGRCVTAPMKSYQWAAFTSLAFNIGVAQFCRSSIARFANALKWPEACAAIELYNRAGGQVVRGLARRRYAERQLCEGKV